MTTTTMETALTIDLERELVTEVKELQRKLRLLDLANAGDSGRAVGIRENVDSLQAAIAASRQAREAEESGRRREQDRWKREQEERERAREEAVAAAVAFLTPLLEGGPVAKADVLAKAEEAGIDRGALGVALAKLDARDAGRYGRNGRVQGGATHWYAGSLWGGGFADLGEATV